MWMKHAWETVPLFLPGSPADRNDCDEILEINGNSLSNLAHQEIIDYIHECIKTRTICLRVKRRNSDKLDSSPIDAFIIGNRAREHFKKIIQNDSITPRDIAQLSKLFSDTNQSELDVVSRNQHESLSQTSSNQSNRDSNSSDIIVICSSQNQDKCSNTASTSVSNSFKYTKLTSESGYSISSSKSTDDTSKVTEDTNNSEPNKMELVELNSPHNNYSIHRELPVDVPDSFVGVVKQTPRYPPPHPPPQPPQRFSTLEHQQLALNNRINSEKIRKYSDEIYHKKEEEEFLRSSIRGSKKLQQLIERNHAEPMVNIAFEPDDEVLVAYNNNTYGSIIPARRERESDKVLPLPYLESVVENVHNSLNNETRELIERSKLKHLVSIYSILMQHQHAKVNSYLDSQQTLRPPSYNSLTRPTNHSEIGSQLQPHYNNGVPFQINAESSELLQEVLVMLQQNPLNSDAAELLEILTRFEIEGLCSAYDRVLVESNKTIISLSPDDLNEEKVHDVEILDSFNAGVKVVQIEKSTCEPLGATVRNEPDGSVIIGRIIKGGAAQKSGMLHEGDEILEVNGIEMKGRNVNQVCDLLAEMTGTLTFVIAQRDSLMMTNTAMARIHNPHILPPQSQVFHLRALYDYDPDEDLYIPCRELGICFNKGDILHVIDQSDVNWWQAYREGDNDQSLAGLIPSIQFQLQREAMKQSVLNDSTVNTSTLNRKGRFTNGKSKSSSLLFNCGKRSLQRNKKKGSKSGFIVNPDEILTYEEVYFFHPRPNFKRPIVLIGPANIGRHELRQRLMQDTERFSAAVPHTSRPRKDGEIDGIDYHFISRQMFEHDIKEGRFVEHGEYEKNYYGTSFAAIEAVVQSSKICILNLHVHSIPLLRQGQAGAKLKPFFVFVTPPTQPENLHRLLAMKSNSPNGDGTTFCIADFQATLDEAAEIESKYGHYFDMILQMTDIERSYQELLNEINALEHEPQWIPGTWIK
ncbi:hypothetical protein RDWZM_000766 [Blomia tropicalis]|uniref:MAGUK p55 subfamily member 5 n=1 Tax=Blomia tropicalis TaxID=40697 RepID=A0A9Q0RQS4_BLOTA|nr:hypothetical protein RDWZM_000766 [Blomia tropicalis]